jgi:hypothetical protein
MLQSRCGFRSLLSMIALAGAVINASADPIPITVVSGVVEFEFNPADPENSASFTLAGTDGFRMSGVGGGFPGLCDVWTR